MKKSLSLALISMFLGLQASADTYIANTAKNQRGEEVSSEYGGYDSTRVTSQLANDEVVCTGHCILAGLIPSTGAVGNLILVYDTSVANVSAVGRLKLTSSFWPTDTGPAMMYRVPRPIRFTNGIAVRMANTSAGENVTVLFIKVDQR